MIRLLFKTNPESFKRHYEEAIAVEKKEAILAFLEPGVSVKEWNDVRGLFKDIEVRLACQEGFENEGLLRHLLKTEDWKEIDRSYIFRGMLMKGFVKEAEVLRKAGVLFQATGPKCLSDLLIEQQETAIEYLLGHGVTFDVENRHDNEMYVEILMRENFDFLEWLQRHGHDVHHDQTALCVFSHWGAMEGVRKLLHLGAEVGAKNYKALLCFGGVEVIQEMWPQVKEEDHDMLLTKIKKRVDEWAANDTLIEERKKVQTWLQAQTEKVELKKQLNAFHGKQGADGEVPGRPSKMNL